MLNKTGKGFVNSSQLVSGIGLVQLMKSLF